MLNRYDAFLSYAHRYQAWVQVLQTNLERCLKAAGREGKVFLDEVDLGSGRSWVGQLQAGLDRSDQLVLVATPEALASTRVADEWRSFVATQRDWNEGRMHIVHLVDVPFPPFLAQIQCVDFRQAGQASYIQALLKLIAAIQGHSDTRNLPELPPELTIPRPPEQGLPPALRSKLVNWLAPILAKKTLRLAAASSLHLAPERLDGQPSWACAASAALVWAAGNEEPLTAALRIVDTLRETFEEDEPERTQVLAWLRAEIATRQAESPERGLIAIWLQSAAKDHERLVPLQEQVDLGLLDRVFVQLELRPDARRAVELKEEAQLRQPLSLLDLLELDRGTQPWVTGHWVVLGDPGSGKTTLLRHLTRALALSDDRRWLPLFESLPQLLRSRESLLERAVERLERAGHPAQGLAEALDREGRNGRLLLLLDGLDEVPKETREKAEQLLRDLSLRWPDTPLVVTSRPIGYRRPGTEFREVDLLPLDREHRRELLARWFGRTSGAPDEARAARALLALDAPELREMAGNPLYLTLMALLFEAEIEPDRNRTRLYDQVFDLLLEGKNRAGARPMERKGVVREVLRRLACGMTEDNRDAEPLTALDDRLYRPDLEELRHQLEQVGRWRNSSRAFLDELAEQTGIVGPHDGPGADWRFWHRTFREALTAERLDEEYRQEGGRAIVVAKAREITAEEDLSRWAEPFALLAGRVDDPDDLIRSLVEANRPLGLRAVATAQSLKDETLWQMLELGEKWQERAKIYQRLPELVGDAGRALALLDQLRQRTRNGNDLYFLYQAVRTAGRRSPEHAREAADLAARLYDHIPVATGAEGEELFRSVETYRDGRVPFWRAIPAGKFLMGSPEEEGLGDERPRHEVTIVRPFQISAVPVTHAQYLAFDPAHLSAFAGLVPPEELGHHPVEGVTWYEALSFCRWLAGAFPWTGGARLPAEQEWEYACRASTQTSYWSGDDEKDLAEVGWYETNSEGRTHRVGEKPANAWGLYDVHGNVWEWTLSPWTDSYAGREGGVTHDPSTVNTAEPDQEIERSADHGVAATKGHESGVGRVMRGGGSRFFAASARAAYRSHWIPGIENVFQGFRVVLPVSPELGS